MQKILDRLRDDRGSSSAEYAFVVLVGVAFAGLLLRAVTSPQTYSELVSLIQRALT